MKAFIYGTVYLENPQRAELVQMWIELMQHINPEFDLLLVDSFTDPLWLNFVPSMKGVTVHSIKEGDPLPPLQKGVNWITFPENLGHLSKHGIDGWGRAFCRGIEFAIQHDYDYVINLESDLLFKLPVQGLLETVKKHCIGCLSCIDPHYFFMENCVCFMDVKFLKERGFIENYDWKNRKPQPLPEYICEAILAPKLFYKRFIGCRDDFGNVKEDQVTGFDYITHAHDQKIYYAFMKKNMPDGWMPPSQRK